MACRRKVLRDATPQVGRDQIIRMMQIVRTSGHADLLEAKARRIESPPRRHRPLAPYPVLGFEVFASSRQPAACDNPAGQRFSNLHAPESQHRLSSASKLAVSRTGCCDLVHTVGARFRGTARLPEESQSSGFQSGVRAQRGESSIASVGGRNAPDGADRPPRNRPPVNDCAPEYAPVRPLSDFR